MKMYAKQNIAIRSEAINGFVPPHPLEPLSVAELEKTRQAIVSARGGDVLIQFRSISLDEPAKEELVMFLEAEHAGTVTPETTRPARLAMVQYDVVQGDKSHEYTHSLVDVNTGKETSRRVIDQGRQAALIM
jgi:primary-amine oxidase